MSLPLKSQQDLYDLWKDTLQNSAPQLTDFLDGAILDSLAGVFSIAGNELQRQTIIQFRKTFIDMADGPDITGGSDDLQTLAIDHYGQKFGRPSAVKAIDTLHFTRANNSAGSILIRAGTIVKTLPDANGNTQRYSTNNDVTMTNTSISSDLSVTVNCTAVVAGKAGSAAGGTITALETTLLDSTISVTNSGNSTGQDAQDDVAYRETIRNLIEALAGATLSAIEATAKTVAGVVTATASEQGIAVKAYNIANNTVSGDVFYVVKPVLYIADSTGTASPALILSVRNALKPVRACGIIIDVQAAQTDSLDWTASITLNPSGPSYASFSTDTSQIVASMKNYIETLPVGTSFIRATANAAMLATYGPAGTNDITAFSTSVPSGDVSATASTKFVSGTVATA